MTDAAAQVNFDPACQDIVQNPYPAYARMRAHDPVHWNPKGFWFVSRYEDVQAALNDTRLLNSPAPFALVHARNRHRFVAADVANNLIAFKDAPEHPALRGWLARGFARAQMARVAELSGLAQTAVADLTPYGEVDLVTQLALPFASRAICRMIGLPEEDAPQISGWSDDFFRLFHAIPSADEFNRLNESLQSFRDYMREHAQRRAASPSEDLISDLATQTGAVARPDEIADNLMLLAADGVGNVQSGITNCLYVLLQQKTLPQQIFDTPKARATLVDECLRLESPGQYQGRIAREALTIGGRDIRAHSIVLLGLASANRDPEAFTDPDRFDPARRRPQHMAFGSGAHMCMGSVLVRKEISAVLEALFASGLQVRLRSAQGDWLARPGHRWLKTLWVDMSGRTARP